MTPTDPLPNVRIEITDIAQPHCFRLILSPRTAPATEPSPEHDIEILLHARQLVHLIHKLSLALSDWQAQTTEYLLDRLIPDPSALSQLRNIADAALADCKEAGQPVTPQLNHLLRYPQERGL